MILGTYNSRRDDEKTRKRMCHDGEDSDKQAQQHGFVGQKPKMPFPHGVILYSAVFDGFRTDGFMRTQNIHNIRCAAGGC